MSTTGHESEAINVQGLKASLKKGGNKGIYNEAICSTASATAAKVTNTTPPSFTLVSGAKIVVKFTYAINVANATLQVGSTAAKPIYFRGAALPSGAVKAGTSLLLSYDGTSYNIIGGLGEQLDEGDGIDITKGSISVDDSVARLGSDDGSAVIPSFDPETDTLHKAAQVLTTAQKDQVAENLNNRPSTNGMGRIELKATDNFKTVVEAQTGGNVIFVIKYDFTLTGDVTIPANCVLEFEGGSISANGNNDTITGNNTAFCGDIKCYCNISGTFSNKVFDVSWLTSSQDTTSALENIVGIGANIYIPEGSYSVTRLIYIPSNTIIYGDGYAKTIINNLITNTFQVNGDNVIIKDLAIVGASQHDDENPFVDQHGICIEAEHKNIYISGCKFSKTVSGVFVDISCENINVIGCIFTQLYTHAPNDNGGYGVVCYGHNDDPNTSPTKCISIINNLFDFVSRHDLYIQSCEDVNIIGNKSYRPTDGNGNFDVYFFRGCKNVTITNNFCHGGATFINCVSTALHPHPDNYIISNNTIRNTYALNVSDGSNKAAVTIAGAGNCIVSNNIFEDNPCAFRVNGDVTGKVVVSNNICNYKTADNVNNKGFVFITNITGSESTIVIKDNQVDIINGGTGTYLDGCVLIGACALKQLVIIGNTFREMNYNCMRFNNTTVSKLLRIQNNTCMHSINADSITNTTKMVYITDNVANAVNTHSADTYYIVRDNVNRDMS